MIYRGREWTTHRILIQQEMDRLLVDFSHRKPPSVLFSHRPWTPSVDVYETENEIIVLVELAGVKQDDVEVEIDDTTLVIRGDRVDSRQGTCRIYNQMEILWGPFERAIALPGRVDVEKAKAVCDDGILEITLPRASKPTEHRIIITKYK
jgi:HSP20 family protein